MREPIQSIVPGDHIRTPVETTFTFDRPAKALARRVLFGAPARSGFGLEKLDDTATFVPDDSTKLPELVARFHDIPGMIPTRRLIHVYLLALGGVAGDVIEIGSWPGKSTAYLAQACADSRNGVVHAIDTFTAIVLPPRYAAIRLRHSQRARVHRPSLTSSAPTPVRRRPPVHILGPLAGWSGSQS